MYLNQLERATKMADTLILVLYKQKESMFNSKSHTEKYKKSGKKKIKKEKN